MPTIPPTLAKAFNATVVALTRAVNEHGAPNSFGISELRDLYGGYKNCGHVGMALRRWPEFSITSKYDGKREVRYDREAKQIRVL